MFQNYKTIKVNCLDENGFELVMRVQTSRNAENKKKNADVPIKEVKESENIYSNNEITDDKNKKIINKK